MKQGVIPTAAQDHVGQQRSIGLVLTGGTIGARHDSVLSVSGRPEEEPQRPEMLGAAEIGLLTSPESGRDTPKVRVRCPLRLLSENLKPTDWIPIAEAVRDLAEIDDVTGIVVFHGTDTMAYTAAALSFLLSDLSKPIVLTGSNLPPDQEGSDAARNAQDALVALDSLPAGTYIVFAGRGDLPGLVHLGTRARKRRASGHAYASINTRPVAEIVDGQFRSIEGPPRRKPLTSSFECKVDPRVVALRLYPGLNFAAAYSMVTEADIRGVVIELYASATGPHTEDEYSLPRFVRRCVGDDVVVVTTVPAAPSDPGNVYETTVAIDKAGGLFLGDMLPETATVKLMWALAQFEDSATVGNLMRTPIAGELSVPS